MRISCYVHHHGLSFFKSTLNEAWSRFDFQFVNRYLNGMIIKLLSYILCVQKFNWLACVSTFQNKIKSHIMQQDEFSSLSCTILSRKIRYSKHDKIKTHIKLNLRMICSPIQKITSRWHFLLNLRLTVWWCNTIVRSANQSYFSLFLLENCKNTSQNITR